MADLRMPDINRAASRRASPAPQQQQHRRQLPNIAVLTSDEANQIHNHENLDYPSLQGLGVPFTVTT
jgi:hypothetical protein